jgi:hypothetical protein
MGDSGDRGDRVGEVVVRSTGDSRRRTDAPHEDFRDRRRPLTDGDVSVTTRWFGARGPGILLVLVALMAVMTLGSWWLLSYFMTNRNGYATHATLNEIATRIPESKSEHLAIIRGLSDVVKELRIQNYLLTLPANERPRIQPPPELSERYHGRYQ